MTGFRLSPAAGGFQDPPAALPHAPFEGVDSIVVESPLPGGVAAVVRFLLNTVPWWVQVGGAVLAAVAGAALLVLTIRRRRAILAWLTARQRWVQWTLAGAVFVLVLAAGRMGSAAWNYTQYDNGFCTGCHVMAPAFQEFMAFEDRHDSLACHDCHQQSVFASMRQLYLWVVERPDEIRPHAKVPNAVCQTCHAVAGDTAVWQRIAATAGHRVHLESDSSALRDVQCVTCHGAEVHRFVPANRTCAQNGCHAEEKTAVVLGRMAGQTALHCAACHRFTADVPLLATRDSARGTLVPARGQCLGCHEMQRVLADFDPALDPHGGTCGTCHNPHTQETPAAAAAGCTAAGCHADWRNEPFHVGREHRRTGEQCLTCHDPHRAKVDASGCEACHSAVRQRSGRRPPLPFDTSRALRGMPPLPDPPVTGLRGQKAAPPEVAPSGGLLSALGVGFGLGGAPPGQAPGDSFPHARHRRLACLECHTNRRGHGALTFEAPRGCAICHHQAPARSDCATCHQPEELAPVRPARFAVAVQGKEPRPREATFAHQAHAARRCVECHTTPVTLAVAPTVANCRACHENHHTPQGRCADCHRGDHVAAGHEVRTAHQRCDACHARGTVALLAPTRPFCATCHAAQQTGHHEPRQCTVCHFLAEPDAYRARLLTPEAGR